MTPVSVHGDRRAGRSGASNPQSLSGVLRETPTAGVDEEDTRGRPCNRCEVAGRRGLRATCKMKQKATVEMQRNWTKFCLEITTITYKKEKIPIECIKTPVTGGLWEWCAGVRASEFIIPEVSAAFNDGECVCRATVAEQKQQQAYFQPCKSNYLKSVFPKSVCNTHEACLCINPPLTMFTIRSPITVIRLGLRICD